MNLPLERPPLLAWAELVACAAIWLIPFCYFVFFGQISGMPWDYGQVYMVESNPGLSGMLYNGDPLRIYTNVFFYAGYYVSKLLQYDGGWIGYHLIYAILWSGRAILIYIISRQIRLPRTVCLAASLLTVVHGSDDSIGHVGQINQLGLTVWTLLAFVFTFRFATANHSILFRYTIDLPLSMAAAYLGLWSHEVALFGLLAIPILVLFLAEERKVSLVPGLLAFMGVPIYYAYLFVERMILRPTGTSYQETVLRKDLFDALSVASDFWYMVRRLFDFPLWIYDKMQGFDSEAIEIGWHVLIPCAALGALLIGLALAAEEYSHRRLNRYETAGQALLLRALLTSLIMCALLLLPFLALPRSMAGAWRTQIIASPWAALAISIGLYLVSTRIRRRWLDIGLRLSVLTGFSLCGLLANLISYAHWTVAWEKVRAPVQHLIEAIPQVRDETIVMLQGVPPVTLTLLHGLPPVYNWASNYWFDLLIRLAYPGTKVSGSYTHSVESENDWRAKGIIAAGGRIVPGQGNMLTVAPPQGPLFVVKSDQVVEDTTYLPTLLNGAPLQNAIVLQWTDNGPFRRIRDVRFIDAATAPNPEAYDPDRNVTSETSSAVTRNRFFHGLRDR
jgi:hypothetical protein